MQPIGQMGGMAGVNPASILEQFRKELSKQFGTEAQIVRAPEGTYVEIPLGEAQLKQIIVQRMSPEYQAITDVKIENNVVKVRLRVL